MSYGCHDKKKGKINQIMIDKSSIWQGRNMTSSLVGLCLFRLMAWTPAYLSFSVQTALLMR